MPELFIIKQNDLRPHLYAVLGRIDEDSGEVPEGEGDVITGATVVFSMRDENGTVKVDKEPVVVDDDEEGMVHYIWQEGDTDTAGTFYGEFQVTLAGEPITYPNDKVGFKIKITEEIA